MQGAGSSLSSMVITSMVRLSVAVMMMMRRRRI
jgi:hypothetical protein